MTTPPDSISTLLRLAADGELSPLQAQQVREYLNTNPDAARSIEFERNLRAACARAMGSAVAPAHLRARILSQAAHSQNAQTLPSTQTADIAQALEARGVQTRERSFWQRMTPAVRALAAAILLLVGGTFIYQVANIGTGSASPALAQLSTIADFVGNEHNRCVLDPTTARKFTIHELASAPEAFAAIVGKSPSFPDLASVGLTFLEGGKCHVPGKGQSMHLRFQVGDSPDRVISLFVQSIADETDKLFEPGKSYQLTCKNLPEAQGNPPIIYGWSADGLNYFLVADDAELCESYRRAVGLARPIIPKG